MKHHISRRSGAAWRQFRTLSHTWGPTPGVREAWHQGRRWYHVWVLRLDDVRVNARRVEIAAALGPMVLPSAPADPHVTVWVHGFETPDFKHPAEGRAVELSVGGASSFATCPFLDVRGAELSSLRARFPTTEERWRGYLPHVTVARYAGNYRVGRVAAALRPWRRLPAIRTVGRLTHVVVDAWDEGGALTDWEG